MVTKNHLPPNGKKLGPRIVRAWFDTVINPLIRALEQERALLQNRNWTWQSFAGRLEGFRALNERLEIPVRDNLEHFLQFYPEITHLIEEHDSSVEQLKKKCGQLQEAIEQEPRLKVLYTRVTSADNLGKLGVSDVRSIFGGQTESEHLGLLAEYIINNQRDLPSYYTTAKVWNESQKEFRDIAQEVPLLKALYDELTEVGELLEEPIGRLIDTLKSIRAELSSEYDEPFVVTTIGSDQIYL